MRRWSRHKNQAGDTIVEVLIAVAVISSVLIGAFLVAQKSTAAVRDSQEHAEVAQILQGQVELVRSQALAQTDSTSGVYDTTPKYFCIDSANNKVDIGNTLPALAADNFNPAFYGDCGELKELYNVAVSYNTATKVFTFVGRWDRVGGGKNQEQMSYRIYPGQNVAAAPSVALADKGDRADVAAAGCQRDAAGACIRDPNPTYRWRQFVKNNSANLSSPVQSCTWEWINAQKIIEATKTNQCNFGDIQEYTWAIPTNPAPEAFNKSCKKYEGTVKLTLTLANGNKPSKIYNSPYPSCY